MIEVNNLRKSYRNKTVIEDVSFSVKKGEIAALVGQNGTGKSTTLRMITGYLKPEAGDVTLNGYSINESPRQAKAQFGYVPENGPLYEEMTVREHLKFRGRLQGLPKRELRDALDAALEKCSLQGVRNRGIRFLSKGYKQRVALADALIGSPPILILDEPTNGLDPHQIVAFRNLLLRLKEDHTLIISSHILSEMEQVADQVVIINKGNVVTSAPPADIIQELRKAGEVNVEIKGDREQIHHAMEALPQVRRVTFIGEDSGWQQFHIYAEAGTDTRENIADIAHQNNWKIRTLVRREANLESAFVELTIE